MPNRKPPDAHDPVRTDALHACADISTSGRTEPMFGNRHIGDELALRASLDPAWDAVLAAWLAGRGWTPCER